MKNTRIGSFVIITVHYLVSLLVGWLFYRFSSGLMHPYWALFVADAAATVYIWILGLVYRNVSFYDPYWSVAPPAILTLWAVAQGCYTTSALLLLLAVWFWAIRLTYNWAVTFHGLDHEDWRYTQFRTQCHPFLFHLINFFGLNMVPTVVVFLGMLPAFGVIDIHASANILTVLGCLLSIGAAVLQLVADTQSHRFRAAHPGKVCNVGVWKHGRHPNYLGEILMWWGVWIMFFSLAGFSHQAWFISGPLSVALLFCTVSIPMMERRQLKSKPEYAQYRKQTRFFL